MALHPQSQAFINWSAAQDLPSWGQISPDESRRIFAGLTNLFGVGPQLPHVFDYEIGDRIPVRVYQCSTSELRPVIMYFHGGGWVLGNLDTHDALCRRIASASHCHVVAVDYRLAPEYPFPAAIDDSYEATEYVENHSEIFRLRPGSLAVAGDSAGGNLAAAVCLKARDEQGPKISLQLLIYPIVDHSFETSSYRDFADGFGLTRNTMKWFFRQYVPHQIPAENAYLAPARATSLRDLPDAHIITAEYDVLRDEGESYADKLANAGVRSTLQRYDGMLHGFIHFNNAYEDGLRGIADLSSVVRVHFTESDPARSA
ncbi:MAG: alpha/beta hydrolase [Pirellulaceae bacterium]|nr:alpha/beta hydrolase [Pirellulaceae bacterium]